MDGSEIIDAATAVARSLPAATLSQPFGPDWDVFKVEGKVFLLLTEVRGEAVATLKCDWQDNLHLQQQHEEITAGYHMNKRHWLSVRGGPGVTPHLVDDLVRGSYDLVVGGLPRHRRPPAPGSGTR